MSADPLVLLKGLLMGFSIAAPVGPVGLLCIQRTLARGRLHGLVSGLGAATADALYGTLAALGLTFIGSFLSQQQMWIRLGGGLFLLYLGLRTLLSRPAQQAAADRGWGLWAAYGTTLLLTLTNPLTILSFAGVLAGLGIGSGSDYGAALMLVVGVFTGSALWWLLLSLGVGLLRARVTPQILTWINRLSGVIIIGLGLWALASAR